MRAMLRTAAFLGVFSLFATGVATMAQAQQSVGSYLDDTGITASVKASILKDQSLKGFDIHVETDHGVVILTGTVQSDLQKNDAERIAETTKGVKDVKNNIVVQ